MLSMDMILIRDVLCLGLFLCWVVLLFGGSVGNKLLWRCPTLRIAFAWAAQEPVCSIYSMYKTVCVSKSCVLEDYVCLFYYVAEINTFYSG